MQLPVSDILEFYSKFALIFEKLTADIIAQYGLTPRERDILLYLDDQNGNGTSADASRILRITKSLVSKTITSLMLRGYIRGEKSSDDRRSVYLKILPAAQPVLRSLTEARKECCNITLIGVTDERLAVFKAAIKRVNANLDACLKD